MKAVVLSETPTKKVIERNRREIFNWDSQIGVLVNALAFPISLGGGTVSFAVDSPIQGVAFFAAGAIALVSCTRGKGFKATIKEFTGETKTKKELHAILSEGERIQLGESRFTKKPSSFTKGLSSEKLYEDKRLSTHEVKNYVKKTNGKLVFEHVITELPLTTWSKTFEELVDNAGLEMVDVSSCPLPAGTGYFECESKGTTAEYEAKLNTPTPVKIEA